MKIFPTLSSARSVFAVYLYLLPISALSYSNSSTSTSLVATSSAFGSDDNFDVCACFIDIQATPGAWINGTYNVTGTRVIVTVNEGSNSTVSSTLMANNSIVVTQTNYLYFAYKFFGRTTETLGGRQVTSRCAGFAGPVTRINASTSVWGGLLPHTSAYENITTYIGQPQFVRMAELGAAARKSFAASVALLVNASSCNADPFVIPAGGTGELKVAVSILTSSSTIFSKQKPTKAGVPESPPATATTTPPPAAPASTFPNIQASSTTMPSATPEPIPDNAPLQTVVSTIQVTLPELQSPGDDSLAVTEPENTLSPDALLFQSAIPPLTTILFDLPFPPPNANQAVAPTPITTTIPIGPSSLPATIVILPFEFGFVVDGSTLTLGGPPATIASQTISAGPSGLQLIMPNPTPAPAPATTDIGNAIARILGATSPDPIITIGTKPYAISAAENGAVVIGSLTLTSGGSILVEGSTLSIAPSGAGIVVQGAAASTTLTGGARGNGIGNGSAIGNPVIVVGTRLFTISAALSGGVVIGEQTLTRGGTVVVEGSTLSIALGGSGIVVSGPAATTDGGGVASASASGSGTTTKTGSLLLETGSAGVRLEFMVKVVWLIVGGLAALVLVMP